MVGFDWGGSRVIWYFRCCSFTYRWPYDRFWISHIVLLCFCCIVLLLGCQMYCQSTFLPVWGRCLYCQSINNSGGVKSSPNMLSKHRWPYNRFCFSCIVLFWAAKCTVRVLSFLSEGVACIVKVLTILGESSRLQYMLSKHQQFWGGLLMYCQSTNNSEGVKLSPNMLSKH